MSPYSASNQPFYYPTLLLLSLLLEAVLPSGLHPSSGLLILPLLPAKESVLWVPLATPLSNPLYILLLSCLVVLSASAGLPFDSASRIP